MSGSTHHLPVAQQGPPELAGIEKECLELFVKHAFWCDIPASTVFIKENAPYDYLIVLTKGLVSIDAPHPHKGFVPTRLMGAGMPYSAAVLPTESSACRAIALAPCQVVFLPNNVLLFAMMNFSRFNLSYAEHLRNSLYATLVLQSKLTQLTSEIQLLFVLFNLTGASLYEDFESVTLKLKVPQALLGAYLGISREEVSRKLKALLEKGLLKKSLYGLGLTRAGQQCLVDCGLPNRPKPFLMEFCARIPTQKPAMPSWPGQAA